MGTEELGSVYESLLELHPIVQVAARPWSFGFAGDESTNGEARATERRLSGSYYMHDALVQEVLRTSLDPLIDRTLRNNPAEPRRALLHLRVLDPACGSGHFLLAAARRLAAEVSRLESEGDLPDETLRRGALREVVQHCIYGVDRNPLAVELCRTALWIETIEPGKPLSFLDAHSWASRTSGFSSRAFPTRRFRCLPAMIRALAATECVRPLDRCVLREKSAV